MAVPSLVRELRRVVEREIGELRRQLAAERLAVPFAAITSFVDPSVQFALQFEEIVESTAETPAPAKTKSEKANPKASEIAGGKLQVAGSWSARAGAETHAATAEPFTRLQFSLPIAFPEARVRRTATAALDSEFLQTVDNGDSTWLPS